MARKIFFILIWVKAVCVFSMFALLSVYYMHILLSLDIYPNYWIVLILLVPGMVVPVLLWSHVHSGGKGRWVPVVFYIESVFTIIIAFLYFSEVMHDIALAYFGHHGRFGGEYLDGGGSPYLLDDSTLPLILFVPVMIAGTVHFILGRRAVASGGKTAS